MLSLQNPLVSVNPSKHMQILPHPQNFSSSCQVNQCTLSFIHFAGIHRHLFHWEGGTGDDKTQRSLALSLMGQENERLNAM